MVVKSNLTDCDDLRVQGEFSERVKHRSGHRFRVVRMDPDDYVCILVIVCDLNSLATSVEIISDVDDCTQPSRESSFDNLLPILVKSGPLQMRMCVDQIGSLRR